MRQAGEVKISAWKGYTGLAFGDPPRPWRVDDEKVAYPMLEASRRIVYHSAFHSLRPALDAARDDFRTSTRADWVTDLCEIRQRSNPGLTNIYAELGSTFGQMVITSPMLCGHVLGMLVQSLGADHVLWGTDSIWWGSPHWQIEALRRFTMPESLLKTWSRASPALVSA